MKQLLITGFDPFGDQHINPAWETVRALPDTLGAYQLTKLEIPTQFSKASEKILALAQSLHPDVILSVGQAGGRDAITPERVAINLMDARIPDNLGYQPREVPIVPGGPDGLFSTLPVSAMAQSVVQAGLPGRVSLSAGSFVCNDTLYRLLFHFSGSPTRVGFVHVPYLPQQAGSAYPSMTLEEMCRGLCAIILALDD